MTKLLMKKVLYKRKLRAGVKSKSRAVKRRRDADHTGYRFKPRFIGQTKGGITPTLKTRLIYSENYNISTDGVGIYWHNFRLNGLYDPDASLGGHQPYFYDQLTALYNKWTVTGCKVNIVGRWRTSNIDLNPLVGNLLLYPVSPTVATLPTSVGNAREQQLTEVRTFADTSVFNVSRYYDISQLAGLPRSRIINDDVYSGSTTADPGQQFYLYVGMVNQSMSYVLNFQGTITLTYYVTFHDPKTVAPS